MRANSTKGKKSEILADALPFPREIPAEYRSEHDEPAFDPKRHLALEPPAQVWSLAEFGYGAEDIGRCASDVAVAGPFRLLSEEGVAAARSVALSLRDRSLRSNRTANYLAGGVYRSKFLRDLCECPQIMEFLSGVAGCELLPHSMPSQQVYINYAPDDLTQAVDTWHVDSIGFDYVLLLNDPATLMGGQFQFFHGTKEEAASLWQTDSGELTSATSKDLPPDRVISPKFPAAGYGVFQQGNLVMHRATRLMRRAERITIVPGQVARNVNCPDPTLDRVARHGEHGEHGIVAEFARHKAWLAQAKLAHLIEEMKPGTGPAEVREALQRSIADVLRAIEIFGAMSGKSERPPSQKN